jgi:hypothetical protein
VILFTFSLDSPRWLEHVSKIGFGKGAVFCGYPGLLSYRRAKDWNQSGRRMKKLLPQLYTQCHASLAA